MLVCEVFLSVVDHIKKIQQIVILFCKKVAFLITERLPNQRKNNLYPIDVQRVYNAKLNG